MVGLVLPALFLAVASDSEDSNEEVWAERFRVADEERKTWNVPPLTLKERMAALLGASLGTGSHVVGLQVESFFSKPQIPTTGDPSDPGDPFRQKWFLCIYRVERICKAIPGDFPRSGQTVRFIDRWTVDRKVPLPGPFQSTQTAYSACRVLAYQVILPFDPMLREENPVRRRHFQNFAKAPS
jgi:hypothetical protein